MNIKENYPKAYGLIKAQILAELNKNGKRTIPVYMRKQQIQICKSTLRRLNSNFA